MTIKEKLKFEQEYYKQMAIFVEQEGNAFKANIFETKAEECAYLYNWLEEQEKMKCKYCNEEMILDERFFENGIVIKYWVCYNCGKACTKEIRKADHKY